MANEQYGVTLTADSQQYQQSLNQSVGSTNALTDALTRAGQAMQSLWQKTNRKLTFIAAGEVAGITAASVAAANLQQQMSQLNAHQVMLGKSTTDYVGTITNLRTGMGQTSQQAIQLVTQLNQLQVPFSQQQATAQNYVKMAAVTGENVNQLTQNQQQYMRSMGASQKSVENYSSMMAKLQTTTGASASATLDFANSIAPISKSLGMTSQQIAGVSASFVKAGSDGGAASNAYTKIMSDVNKAVQYGGPELKVYSDLLGVSVSHFKAMPKAEVITDIFDSLNKQGPAAIKTLEQLGLDGVRTQKAIASVMQQGGLRSAIDDANSGYQDTGKYTAAAKEAMSGLNDEMAKTRESLSSIAQGFGSIFIPALSLAAKAVNLLLTPLQGLGDMLSKLPNWAKIAGTAIAGVFVAANVIPRAGVALAGLSWVSQALRGPLSQGARAGFRPGNLNPVQRNFMEGEGAAGPRALFNLGQMLGNNARPSTWISRLGGDPAEYFGEGKPITRLGQNVRKAAIGGINLGGVLAQGAFLPWQPGYIRDPSQMHKNPRIADMMITDKGSFGEMLRSPDAFSRLTNRRGGGGPREGTDWVKPLAPGAAGNLINPDNFTGLYQKFKEKLSAGDEGGQGFFGTLFGKAKERFGGGKGDEATGAAGSKITTGVKDMAAAVAADAKVLGAHSESIKSNQSVMGTLFSNLKKISQAGGAAFLGGGELAARGVAKGGMKLGNLAMSALGDIGPVGIAMGLGSAAVSAGSYLYNKNQADIAATKAPGDDESVGSTYRNALGESSKALLSFTDVLKQATTAMGSSTQTMNQALKVTSSDVASAGKMTGVQEPYIKNASTPEAATSFVASLIRSGGSPADITAAKLDLVKKYGQINAQNMLNAATNQSGSPYALMTSSQQGPLSIGLSKENQANAPLVTSTIQAQQAAATAAGPLEGARQYLSNFSGIASSLYNTSQPDTSGDHGYYGQVDASKSRRATDAGNSVTMAAIRQFTSANGLDEKDVATLKDTFNKFGSSVDVSKLSNEQFQKQFGDYLKDQVKNNQWGSEQLRKSVSDSLNQTGGVLPTTGQTSVQWQEAQKLENPFGEWGDKASRDLMAKNSPQLARLLSFGQSSATSPILSSMGEEHDYNLQGRAVSSMYKDVMKEAGGDFNKANAMMVEANAAATDTSGNFKQLVAATQEVIQAQQAYANMLSGHTTLIDQSKQLQGQFGNTLSQYQKIRDTRGVQSDDPRLSILRGNLDDQKKQATQLSGQINDYMQNLYQQYRSFDRQRDQGQAQLDRTIQRSARDYGIQMKQADEDFTISRSRNEYNYQLQRSRGISDFHLQETRANADYNKQRSREEQDHQLQLKRMAEDSAKSFYDVYTRITTQRTWDSASLLQNMSVQTQAISQQKTDLNTLRKMGLSNAAIQQLGLADPQQAQEVTRLLQGLQANPSQIKQFNAGVGAKASAAGSLATDSGNTAYQRSEDDRKRSLKRNQQDFDQSMDRQRDDFRKQLNRSEQDFSRSMSQSQSDYDRMRKRQRDNLKRSWSDMQNDFDYQMGISEQNINFYAQMLTTSFDTASKTVASRTSGITKQQVTAMTGLMGSMKKVVTQQIDDMDTSIAAPFTKWNLTPANKRPATYTVNGSSQAAAHDVGGSHSVVNGGPSQGDEASMDAMKNPPRDGPNTAAITPVKGQVTQGWGGKHHGVDIAASMGTPVFAMGDGVVTYAGNKGSYGNLVEITHANGMKSRYAHQSRLNVRRGDEVYGGEPIGAVGSSGRSTGSHLHLEVKMNGRDVNPLSYFGGSATLGGALTSQGGPSYSEEAYAQLAKIMPDFKKMTQKFEGTIGSMNYLSQDRQQFHSGSYYKPGALAGAIQDEFSAKWLAKHGAEFADTSTGAFGAGTAGGATGSRGVWNALRSSGLTPAQAAGVMGNMDAESNFAWNVVQGGGHSNNPSSTSAGYGLVQWTPGSKLTKILRGGHKSNSLENQVWALMQQLSGHAGNENETAAGTALKTAKTVLEATSAFMLKYERPGNQSSANVAARAKKSQYWYDKYKGVEVPTTDGGSGGPVAGGNYAKALAWAKTQVGLPYVFGSAGPGGYDCSGFMAAIQNVIENKPIHHRRYSTPDFHGQHAEGFTHNKKSAFMVGVLPNSGRSGHMAGTLNGVNVESHGGGGVDVGKKARGYMDHMFTWRGGLATGTNAASSGWHWVGENGPELRHFKGGETVLTAAQSMNAMMRAKSNQVVSASGNHITTNNNSFDHSVQVASVTVKADNPRTMLTELEREARFAALTGTKK